VTRRSARPAGRAGLSLRGLAQAVIGLIALALVIMKSDARGLAEAIKATRIAYLPLAVVASFIVTWLMAYRWGAILSARGHLIKTRTLFGYYLVGIFFMNFVPGGGVSGDVARLIYVNRKVRDKAFVLSTLVYERLVGLFTLLLIGFAATIAQRPHPEAERVILLCETLLGFAFAITATLMSEYVSSRLARLITALSVRLKAERVGRVAVRTLEAMSELRRRRWMLLRTIAVSIMIRVVWGVGCFIVAKAMGLPLGLPIVFAFISLVDLIRMLPISIGGLGVREWVVVMLFASAGISRERALTFSILAFAPIYLNAIAGGLIYISTAKVKRAGNRIAELDLERSQV
jgi:glycosyltransferase 2 family protein